MDLVSNLLPWQSSQTLPPAPTVKTIDLYPMLITWLSQESTCVVEGHTCGLNLKASGGIRGVGVLLPFLPLHQILYSYTIHVRYLSCCIVVVGSSCTLVSWSCFRRFTVSSHDSLHESCLLCEAE